MSDGFSSGMAMKLRGLVVAVVTVAALTTAAAASAATPRAELVVPACRHALDPPDRAAAITAVMRPVPGTTRMSLKFLLERRIGLRGGFRVMRARGLGTWVYPTNPATLGQNPADVWSRTQNVVNLVAPAYYRFRVVFRWLGAGDRVLAVGVRRAPACYQPELRPNVVVRSLAIAPAGNQQDRYVAEVLNTGATPSGPFYVSLALPSGSSAAQSQPVDSLAPGASVSETFVGPACAAGASVTAVADPTGQVDDSDRSDNTLTVTCPSPSGA